VGGVSPESYNLPLHVGALIIIWFVSSLACCFPILAKRFPGLRIPQTFFFLVRHFGTGVLIATAFVHLLPTAFLSLGNPCLGDFWTVKFPAMPGAISLGAIFLVTIIEMVFHPSRRCTSGIDDISGGIQLEQSAEEAHVEHPNPIRDMAPPRGRTGSLGHGLNRLQTREESVEEDEQDNPQSDIETNRKDGSSLVKVKTLSPEQRTRKERMQCVMLELGILFHSVFIGMALSVAIGDDFVVLLIAIAFHRKHPPHPPFEV
jgi:zinc transporter ZupT